MSRAEAFICAPEGAWPVRILRCFLALAVSCSAFGSKAHAQSQPTTFPPAPPDVLVLVRREFPFGEQAARVQREAALARAFDRMEVPNLWIDLESITGSSEALSFDPFDSFAQVDDAFAAWPRIFAAHPELARMQGQLRAQETSERTIIALRRNDLSYQAGSIDLSQARFMRLLEVRVLPGHEEEFVEAFQALRAAYLKISAGLHWVVYQVNLGMPTPSFLVFVPMHALGQNDDLLSWRPLLREAEGEETAVRTQQIAREAYVSTESNLYAISPEMSHVSKDFAESDPAFWSPKAAASLSPAPRDAAANPPAPNRSKTKQKP